MAWDFYGRTEPLAELRRMLEAGRWFFCRIEGRRRIGKTALLSRLAKLDQALSAKLIYMQVPDSDRRDVATTFARSLRESESEIANSLAAGVTDFASMADAIGKLCVAGFIVVLDEFQYFTRASLRPFNSFLQAEVDKLHAANLTKGGLFVLGSLHSEMNALLDEKSAPLYGRITAQIQLEHWDFEDMLSVFEAQNIQTPAQWLTLWTFFEGVPKFYQDAYDQGLFDVANDAFASELLARLFLRGSSPLSEEADTWFLRELRGRGLSILNFLSSHAGCNNAALMAGLSDPQEKKVVSAQLNRLVVNYGLIDKRQPVFSKEDGRNARYYIADNFLQAWLAVVKPAREAARLKPLTSALEPALRRLETLEGYAFEKLIRSLHVEVSRKGKSDFPLSEIELGYWNRPRDVANAIEIDVVALNSMEKKIRFGSCKRSASAHNVSSLKGFEQHITSFLAARQHGHLASWQKERVLFSPTFTKEERAGLNDKGYTCRDLSDYARMLKPEVK